MMNLDRILQVFGSHGVACLLLGGVNFLLRHAPVMTFDVDLWIEDTPENRARCEAALSELGAEWGPSENDWRPVAEWGSGWIDRQAIFCLTSPHGAIDIFRSLRGLESWAECRTRAVHGETAAGAPYWGLSDEDMLECQLALPEEEQKQDRIRILRKAIEARPNDAGP